MQKDINPSACRFSGLGSFSAPFWDAAVAKQFVFQFDAIVGRPQFYPRPVGVGSGSQSLSWKVATGKGRVVAVTTVSIRPEHPEYALVAVDMLEGFRVVAKYVESGGSGAYRF